ncbi:Hypothetical predicted protein [Octopus vulgaris]|uniref:Uncharacterized protein n=1 Tax=Octopus vulgaris TaxID=6645 RepID=A0AA36FBF9_OCTVU|nr:Hypothetical predicted protein [Octopus vulgaris]
MRSQIQFARFQLLAVKDTNRIPTNNFGKKKYDLLTQCKRTSYAYVYAQLATCIHIYAIDPLEGDVYQRPAK